jgi:hypothetical protein
VTDHRPLCLDGNALGDPSLFDHADSVLALDILGSRTRGDAVRQETRLAAAVIDPLALG